MDNMRITLIGTMGTAASVALETAGDVAKSVGQTSIAQWANIATITVSAVTSIWILVQIYLKLEERFSRKNPSSKRQDT